jgi:hypothetical protein
MAQQRQFYTELKSVAAEKERLAKKAQELERSMVSFYVRFDWIN